MSNLVPIQPSEVVPIPMEQLRQLRNAPGPQAVKQVALWTPNWYEPQDMRVFHTGKPFEEVIKQGWRRNELIFTCISKTAKAKGAAKLKAVSKKDGKDIPDNPFIRLLNAPNPYMSWLDFIAATTVFQKLSGHAYWEIVYSKAGIPVELWPIRPDWITVVQSNKGIAAWKFQPPGMPEPQFMKPEQVLDLHLFDPSNMFAGTAPALVAAYAVDTDNAMSAFVKAFFERGAMPMVVLTTEGFLTEEGISTIRAGWGDRYGGAQNWVNAPGVLHSGASVQKLNISADDMGLATLDARNEVRICMVMDIPPIMVGASVGLDRATYSNAEQAEDHWWRNTLVPDLRHDSAMLERQLLPLFGDTSVKLEWDWTDVQSLQEDESARWTRVGEAFRNGAMTVDEYRGEIGMDPLPKDQGNVFILPSKSQVVPADELAATPAPSGALAPMPQSGALQAQADAAAQGTAPQDAPNAPADMGGMLGGMTGQPAKSNGHVPSQRKADPAPDDALRRQHEQIMQDALAAFFTAQAKRVEAVVSGTD